MISFYISDQTFNGSILFYQVIYENLNPVWNQTFDFLIEDALHDMLIAEVWDHDTFGKVIFKRLLPLILQIALGNFSCIDINGVCKCFRKKLEVAS